MFTEIPYDIPVVFLRQRLHKRFQVLGIRCIDENCPADRITINVLAVDTISEEVLWETDKPLGRLYLPNIKSKKIVPMEDLPLYIGWCFTWPLLAHLIKKFHDSSKSLV